MPPGLGQRPNEGHSPIHSQSFRRGGASPHIGAAEPLIFAVEPLIFAVEPLIFAVEPLIFAAVSR